MNEERVEAPPPHLYIVSLVQQLVQDQALILLFRSFSDGRAIDRRHYLSARAGKISFDAIDILLLDHSTILDASEKRRRLPEVEEVIIE